MSYTALARRYRSQSFDEVVGQEPIAQTLRNAIASDRLHHAYLFTGTRGVGKTTMARLFARALNAPDTMEGCPRPKGVTFPAKDVQQRMADAIMRGEDLNVIEIDGASNRGVDDARQLIASAALAPTGAARFKVYIIDEVHMLTPEAFNALLKTMEEPPAHLKFILCTTEPHKVLATIQSRCQRFDFRNIPGVRIVEHLQEVLKREKVKADASVPAQVAREASGSMRDALSLLDRLLATGVNPLTTVLLEEMLGLPDASVIGQLVSAMASADPGAVLSKTDELLSRGIAQDQLVHGLIQHLRDLMVLSACGPDTPLVEREESGRKVMAEQAGQFEPPLLSYMIAVLENVQRQSSSSAAPRALLEAALVRLALSEKFLDLAAASADSGTSVQKKKLSVPPSPPVPERPPVAGVARSAADRPRASVSPPAPRPVPAAPSPARSGTVSQSERDEIMRLPLVRKVADLFDAQLVDIRRASVEPVENAREPGAPKEPE